MLLRAYEAKATVNEIRRRFIQTKSAIEASKGSIVGEGENRALYIGAATLTERWNLKYAIILLTRNIFLKNNSLSLSLLTLFSNTPFCKRESGKQSVLLFQVHVAKLGKFHMHITQAKVNG